MQEAQKKKLSKKKMPQERFRRVRATTNATRVGSAPPFREKVDENNSGFAVANSSTNQNLKTQGKPMLPLYIVYFFGKLSFSETTLL